MYEGKTSISDKVEEKIVETGYMKTIIQRAKDYVEAGFPVHFRGPSGTGKTTLAIHLAKLLGKPIEIIFGNFDFNMEDLIGGQFGLKRKTIIDNYIRSVIKTEEQIEKTWVDGRILNACINGYTLIYDEFTRTRPEINNLLLSILEEKIVEVPFSRKGGGTITVHPDFSVIFTSNTEEYVGVYKTQDALRDRMITIDLDYFDRDTEIKITIAHSGIIEQDAEFIVDLIKYIREALNTSFMPSIRYCIKIAKVLKSKNIGIGDDYAYVKNVIEDILKPSYIDEKTYKYDKKIIQQIIKDRLDNYYEKSMR